MKTKINVGLIGYGVVGSGVAALLKRQKKFYQQNLQAELKLKAICDRRINKKLPKGLGGVTLTKDPYEIINDPDINVIVELIGGKEPAKQFILTALKNGKHVVTANKDLIANYGPQLFKTAQKYKTRLYYESSVGAGIPVIRTITDGVVGNRFDAIYGIVNGTCNYILSQMDTANLSFDEAVKLAQEKGYAESDPTLDINGMDAAHKIAILVHLAMGKVVKLKDIYVEGITHISHDDIEFAKELGLCIKLLAIAKKHNKDIELRVHPTLIAKRHPLASVNDVYNAVFLHTEPMGNILLQGEGAGQMAAASGVISDLIHLAFDDLQDNTWMGNNVVSHDELKLSSIDDLHTEYYLRVMVKDKPGVLASITSILGKHDISIASFKQKHVGQDSAVPIIILTHQAKEASVKKALQKIQQLSDVKGRPVVIRLENIS